MYAGNLTPGLWDFTIWGYCLFVAAAVTAILVRHPRDWVGYILGAVIAVGLFAAVLGTWILCRP